MKPPEIGAADKAVPDGGAPDSDPPDSDPPDSDPPDGELPHEISGLSLTSRIVIALTVAAVAIGAAVHLGMVFLSIAPSNILSQRYATAINDYIYPEFEQNWKLFAPNPVQENDDVQARAEILLPQGTGATTGWVDLTAMDEAQIIHNPFPSHTRQNELRRAWSFYTDTHNNQGQPVGLRGTLSQEYLLRIVAHRFGPRLNGGTVRRIQLRLAATPVAPPPWSSPQTGNAGTNYQLLPWWNTSSEDFT